jgi:UDP-N-acetyl-D-mannosaminuronic acid transferase (WecB/TagA/CpsF family)
MAAQNVTDNRPDGAVIGASATEKIAFYGATPVTQRAGAAQVAVATTAATSTTPHGFAEAQANALVALVNELRAALVAVGIIKGAA